MQENCIAYSFFLEKHYVFKEKLLNHTVWADFRELSIKKWPCDIKLNEICIVTYLAKNGKYHSYFHLSSDASKLKSLSFPNV